MDFPPSSDMCKEQIGEDFVIEGLCSAHGAPKLRIWRGAYGKVLEMRFQKVSHMFRRGEFGLEVMIWGVDPTWYPTTTTTVKGKLVKALLDAPCE